MASACVGCGVYLSNVRGSCSNCGVTARVLVAPTAKPMRHGGIPLIMILSLGLAVSLAAGAGKPSLHPPVPAKAVLSASINGNPVRIGGPAIALLQKQFPGALSRNTITAKTSPAP